MNRRELVKLSAAAGVMAAVPFSLATTKRPTVTTTQSVRTQYTVTAWDVTHTYAKIAITWPSAFADTNYVAVGSHLYHSSNLGTVNCTVDGGNTLRTKTGITKVVEFNNAVTTPVAAGDLIDADFIAIGQV